MMEHKERKRNRLECYDYSQNGGYFITVCTDQRLNLLSKIDVGDGFPVPKLTPIGKIVEENIAAIHKKYAEVTVDKAVIMPNHIHMIILITKEAGGAETAHASMGKVMGWFKYQTTKQVNLLRGTPGERFWQRSFFDHVIQNEHDYRDIWNYIENNPLKWNLDRFYWE